jgi:hypothetical protein
LRHGLKLGRLLLIECLLIDCVDSISCRLPELGQAWIRGQDGLF